ncbi:MAG TPA: type IV toxin-antitoxin system AbiEi family antitoxin domain-containing protein [Solirubrobacterales bacterium]|nr:type IV toxin-antitoxin system AbiEi family antitoxin domain-containing protein [Solirubrobacterales bacterium]
MEFKRRTGKPDRAIGGLAERQHGVVSRRQLRALGLTDRQIAMRTQAGTLHPLFHGTFAVGHLAIGRYGRMLAAVLACGNGAVLSHGSAAELLGLWDRRPVSVDVIVPRRAGRKIDRIRWHNVRRPAANEIQTPQSIPCTTPSRTLVDMAGRLGATSLRRMVEQAAVLRVLDVPEIDRVLARGRRRGAPRLRAVLATWRSPDEWVPRFRSLLEARFLPLLVEAGAPRPQCNAVPQVDGRPVEMDGKPIEVDLLWQDQRLVVETDGEETHGTQAAFQEDRKRDQVLGAAGYRIARVTWAQLEDEPDAVVSRVRRMLASG